MTTKVRLESRDPITTINKPISNNSIGTFITSLYDLKEPNIITDNYFNTIIEKIYKEPNTKYDIPIKKKKKKKKKKFVNRKKWRTFEESRSFVYLKNFKNLLEWKRYCRFEDKPDDIPTAPNKVYPKQFINWYDWLGKTPGHNDTSNRYNFRTFESARNFVHSLNIKNFTAWHIYCKSGNKPKDIPTNPYRVYKGWISWGDFLGNKNVFPAFQKFKTYKQSIKFVHKLKLKNVKEWEEYCKTGQKPSNIPFCPYSTYRNKGWVNWYHWLGLKLPNSYLNK